MTDHPKPSGLMNGVLPYLAFASADKAIAFYEKAFGAVVHDEIARQNGHVLNAMIEINGGIMMLMDAGADGCGDEDAAATSKGMTLQLVTYDGDMWWNRAVAAGCTVTMPFTEQFWGDRYGRLRDPFGLDWAINEPGKGKG